MRALGPVSEEWMGLWFVGREGGGGVWSVRVGGRVCGVWGFWFLFLATPHAVVDSECFC